MTDRSRPADQGAEEGQQEAAVLLLDGGLSTQLESMGIDISGPLWTARALVDDPDAIVAAHAAYVAAGADVITTASYQVSRHGLGSDADHALRASVDAAREAGAPIVAASIGPYGAVLHDGSEYRGGYGRSRAELAAFHAERIAVLADAGPDCLAIETIPDGTEVDALVDALTGLEIPTWVSFSLRDAEHLADGTPLAFAVESALRIPSLMAIGVNCVPADCVTPALQVIARNCDHPLVAYPNGGGTWDAVTGTWSGTATMAIAAPTATTATIDDLQAWIELGAVMVGGCCGTDAGVIAAYAGALSSS